MGSFFVVLQFGFEFIIFLMCFAIAYVAWQLYHRNKRLVMMAYAFGFSLTGLSGVIHSFNLTSNLYLSLMMGGKLLGYSLILWAVTRSKGEGLRFSSNFAMVPMLLKWIPFSNFLGFILSAGIAWASFKRRNSFRAILSSRFSFCFLLISLSEAILTFTNRNQPYIYLSYILRLIGFGILAWTFLRVPRLKFVEKLQVVLRGLVLMTVILVIMPLATLILYNIRMNAFSTVDRDSQRIHDYFEKDKQHILSTAYVISVNPVVQSMVEGKNGSITSRNNELRKILQETGNDFIVVIDRYGIPVAHWGLMEDHSYKWQDQWVIEKAFAGQRIISVQENFISPLDILGAAPLYLNGKAVGIVITGVSINDVYLNKMKKDLQLDTSVYKDKNLVATSFKMNESQRQGQIYSIHDSDWTKIYSGKQNVLNEIYLFSRPYYAAMTPIFGPRQKVLGVFINGVMSDDYEHRKSEILAFLILITIPVTLIAWVMGSRLSRTMTNSIEALGHAAQEVTQGNLDVKVPTQSSDELAELANLFNNMTAKLKEIDTLKSEYYSFLSHEIRTPLTALKGASEALIENQPVNIEPSQKQMLEIIAGNVSRLNRLVDNFLQMAKLEAGKVKLYIIPVDISQLVENSFETFSILATEKNITLESYCPEDILKPMGDSDWLLQVLNNLLSNAIKFTPPNGKIQVTVGNVSYKPMNHDRESSIRGVKISVSDSGIGIKKEEIEHIFEKYHQVRSQRNPLRGTGLGLPISQYIIQEIHHGEITVESKEGIGTTFNVIIPEDFTQLNEYRDEMDIGI